MKNSYKMIKIEKFQNFCKKIENRLPEFANGFRKTLSTHCVTEPLAAHSAQCTFPTAVGKN